MNRHQIIRRINLSYKHIERLSRNIAEARYRMENEELSPERTEELQRHILEMEWTLRQIQGEIASLKEELHSTCLL